MTQLYLSRSQLQALLLQPCEPGLLVQTHDEVMYLSNRNVNTLLVKLDRVRLGEVSKCTVIKHRQPLADARFNQTMDTCMVTGLEDEAYAHLAAIRVDDEETLTLQNCDVFVIGDDDYYGAQGRPAGAMLPVDEAKLPKPSTGIAGELAREKWGYGHGGAEGEWAQYDGV